MAELIWSADALDWLEAIDAYIRADNPMAADKVIDGIVQQCEHLVAFPDMGQRLRIVAEGDIRVLAYGHYRIAYLHPSDMDRVVILGVFHGALDFERYLP